MVSVSPASDCVCASPRAFISGTVSEEASEEASAGVQLPALIAAAVKTASPEFKIFFNFINCSFSFQIIRMAAPLRQINTILAGYCPFVIFL